MPFIIQFLERFLTPSLIKYYLIGGIAVLLHIVIVVVVIELWDLLPSLANAIAFILATIFSSIANTYWSFQANLNGVVLFRFWCVAALGLCLAIIISGIADYLRFHYLLGVMMVVSITPVVSYTLHKNWTYK